MSSIRPAAVEARRWLRSAASTPARGVSVLRRECVVPASLDEVFAFFADAGNLESLTPPWLQFRILTPIPLVMRPGLLIDYRIRLHGVAIPWTSVIDVWEPGVRFVDRQLSGPYRWWHHLHRFESCAGGTRVIDEVEYVPKARWVSRWFVDGDLARIFDYRQTALGERFANRRAPADGPATASRARLEDKRVPRD